MALQTRGRRFTPTVFTNQGIVRHVDAQGRLRWERPLGAAFSIGAGIAALPDGSYVAVMNDPSRRPGIQNRWTFDLRLTRFSPTGQRLDSAWVGRAGDYDFAYAVHPTTDGGLVIVGTNDENLPNTPERSVLYKLDSAWREQWRLTVSGPGNISGTISDWHWVRETAGGRFLVGGRFDAVAGLGLVAPPASPLDSVGSLVWADRVFLRQVQPIGVFVEPGSGGLKQVVASNCGGYVLSTAAPPAETTRWWRATAVGIPRTPTWRARWVCPRW